MFVMALAAATGGMACVETLACPPSDRTTHVSSSPIAAHATVEKGKLLLRGLYYREDTEEVFTGRLEGDAAEAESIGISLAKKLLADAGKEKQ